jgi:hypothetical protein
MKRRRKLWIAFLWAPLAAFSLLYGLGLFGVLLCALPAKSDKEHRGYLYNAMFSASRDNDYLAVRCLVAMGASPDGASDYESRYVGTEFTSHVECATASHNWRILRYLLSNGANPNLDSEGGALTTAIHDRQPEAVRLLLAAGAQPRYSPTWTAADLARSLGYPEIAEIVKPYLKP